MTKTQVQAVVKEVTMQYCADNDIEFTRDIKWHLFLQCVDGLLKDGKITKRQHKSWTNPF